MRFSVSPCLRVRGSVPHRYNPDMLKKVAEADFPTRWGHFRIHGFESPNKETAVALTLGDLQKSAPLVHIPSQCLTGDFSGSLPCDCLQQLDFALSAITSAGAGVLVYEQQEG